MISVLGLPVERAIALLEQDGFAARLTETRSKKGVDSEDYRVVRQKPVGSGVVELTVAAFKTELTLTQ